MVILVALFVEQEDIQKALNEIKAKFQIQGNKIFILNQIDEPEELILTFNIELPDNYKENLNITDFGKLIRIHRKKEFNCLYTINALNFIIKNEETLDWNKYKFCFLTISSNHIKVIKTKLKEVFDLNNLENYDGD